jgi:DNA processing protein
MDAECVQSYDDSMGVIPRSAYPDTLKNMGSPPPKLFVRGRFPAPMMDQKYLCVVGSRRWTSYGRECVRRLVSGLAGYPVTIVSGLAIGIDSIAHIAALEAGLHCVGFPGSSLDWDEIYPEKHLGLAKRIVASGGALLSAWEPGYPTGNWAFPARNRLMAGLSHAVLIIEAGQRSGSLMTAKHAEDFNRDVFAVPGQIREPQSYGTHMLIKNGAALISSSRDILIQLGFNVPRSTQKNEQMNGKVIGQKSSEIFLPSAVTKDDASMSIMKVLMLEDATADYLLDKTCLKVQTLNEKLSLLELEGLIKIEGPTISLVRN